MASQVSNNIAKLKDILAGFFHQTRVMAYPLQIPSASNSYKVGSSYAKLSFPNSLFLNQINPQDFLECHFSFYWTSMLWGHVKLITLSGLNPFSRQEQGDFFTHLRVTLYTADDKKIRPCLIVDKNGNFLISEESKEIEQIKQYLQKKMIHCALSLDS